MTSTCPTPEVFSRQLSIGESGPLEAHLSACTACALEWEGMSRVRALTRDLPAALPGPRAVVAIRERVISVAVAERRRARAKSAGRWGLLLAAAVVVLAIGLRSRAPVTPVAIYRATLTPSPGARFVRASAMPTEIARLEAGTLHVSVAPLQVGERFIVQAGDGEVEVRGTAFDVSVLDGHLTEVHVDHGRVEVRGAGATTTMLGAGDDWRRAPQRSMDDAAPPPAEATSSIPVVPAASPHRVPAPGSGTSSAGAPRATPPVAATPASSVPPSSAGAGQGGGATDRAGPAPTTSAVPQSPDTPAPPPVSSPEPTSTGVERDREAERRERRDERRDRGDQRRLR